MRQFYAAAAIAALCVALSSPAFAWADDPAPTPPPMTTKQLNKASAKAAAASYAASRSKSASTSSATASPTAVGSVTTTYSSNTPRQASPAPGLGGLSSGPCTGASGGISFGTLMFGGGLQGGGLDPQCTLRNNITTVGTVDPELAREMMNDLDGVKEAKARLGRTP